jgi:hypothetical protein
MMMYFVFLSSETFLLLISLFKNISVSETNEHQDCTHACKSEYCQKAIPEDCKECLKKLCILQLQHVFLRDFRSDLKRGVTQQDVL